MSWIKKAKAMKPQPDAVINIDAATISAAALSSDQLIADKISAQLATWKPQIMVADPIKPVLHATVPVGLNKQQVDHLLGYIAWELHLQSLLHDGHPNKHMKPTLPPWKTTDNAFGETPWVTQVPVNFQ